MLSLTNTLGSTYLRNCSAAKTGHDDVTAKHADETMPDIQSLLLERRDVTPDSCEVLALPVFTP